jgi:mycothiol synthase
MPDVHQLDRFAPADVGAIRVLADTVEDASGASPFGEVTWDGLAGRGVLGDHGLLVRDPSGEAALAYAHVAHHQPDEWVVELATAPEATGLEPSLLARAIDLVANEGGGHLTLWLHGPVDDQLAPDAGFALERELLELRVGLPLDEEPRWPNGIAMRTFVVGQDEEAWLRVNNRAFAGHPEQGGWTLATLQQREASDWFDPDGFLLAFDGDVLAGFCWTKVHAPTPPKEPVARGEIYVIGADPSQQGRGLGRALTVGGLASLAGRGITVGMLYVDAANTAAVALYRSLGFVEHQVDRAYGRVVTPASS